MNIPYIYLCIWCVYKINSRKYCMSKIHGNCSFYAFCAYTSLGRAATVCGLWNQFDDDDDDDDEPINSYINNLDYFLCRN